MRPHGSICSDWFEVEQRLRQGCVLSPLVSQHIFCSRAADLQRFSEDTVIFAQLVHLKEMRTSMDYAHRAVSGMLYMNVICIASQSPQGLAKMMEAIVEVPRAVALTVLVKKAETMYIPSPQTPWTIVRVELARKNYEQVSPFTYMRGTVTKTPGMPVVSPREPTLAESAPDDNSVSSTISRKWRSPSRSEW